MGRLFAICMRAGGNAPLLSELSNKGAGASGAGGKVERPENLVVDLSSVSPPERLRLIDEKVRLEVARVLGLSDPRSINPGQSLFELGLDSLMAMELRRRLGDIAETTFPAALAFNYPNVSALVALVDETVGARAQTAGDAEEIGELLSRIDDLSGAATRFAVGADAARGKRALTGQPDDAKRERLRRLLLERMANAREPQGQKPASASRPIELGPPFERAPRTDDLELSFGQEMIWLQEQMIPEAMLYNLVERFAVKGRLDVELLRRCVEEVVKRHEILRTVYPVVAGRPVQRVEPPYACSLQRRRSPGPPDRGS